MRILIIDDNPHDAEMTQFALKKMAGVQFDYVEDFTNFKKIFTPGKYAAVISDYSLSDCLGTDVLKFVREQDTEIPFIIISGALGEEAAVNVLRLGATDYVLKDSIDKLPLAFSRALKEAETKKAARIVLQKLTESEERYRLLAENLQITNTLLSKNEQKLKEAQSIALLGNWEIDLTNNKHVWSDEFYKIFGITKGEVSPSPEAFLSFIHREDLEYTKGKIEEAFSSSKDSSFNFRFTRKGNSVHYGYSQYKFEFDQGGKPLRLYGIVQDITDRKKAEKEILKKNKQLRDLSIHLQNIREDERTNVAREIHDELGQQLTALKMDIDWVLHKQTNAEKLIIDKLQGMLKMSEGIINTVRRISSDLRPALIDDLGLIATIEWKCADFEEKTGIPCQFISAVKERIFNKQFSINVYRILQETLTNVSRHAEAKSVTVLLTENGKELFLEIMDDGKGITKENINNSKRLGILGMKERVGLLEGELIINGTTKGTCVKLILPLKNEYINS